MTLENSVKMLKDTNEAVKNSYILDRKFIRESKIPLEALYNPTIEKIKAIEISKYKKIGPIIFEVHDGV
jgi:hypothetical protein